MPRITLAPARQYRRPVRLDKPKIIRRTADKQLVRHDIRAIVTCKPELKPAIFTAYQNAPPMGQQFLKEAQEEIDPALLAGLRPK